MKQASTLLSAIVILLAMLTLHSSNASAKLYMGKITMQVGETRSVEAVPPISAYTASGSFSKSGTSFAITASGSYTCKIKANYVGTGTLSYWGSVARSNTWTTEIYDLYWDVEVVGNGGSSGSSSGSNTEEFDEVQEPTDDWGKSGNYSISWYNKNKTEFTISTNKELAGMAYLINNGYTTFENCTLKMANDIDLSNKKWIACKDFKGTFDGQGHSINGVFIGTDEDTQLHFGFWKRINKAKIVNLRLNGTAKYETKERTNKTIVAGGMVGGVTSTSLIQNCIVNMDIFFRRSQVTLWSGGESEGDIRNEYSSHVGGIVGSLEGCIKNCLNLGSVRYYVRETSWVQQGLCLGGIAGSCSSTNSTIEYCENLSPLIKFVEKGNGEETSCNFFKWISGICYDGEIVCCRSVIDEIYVDVTHHAGIPTIYLSGISTRGKSTNCYSVVTKLNFKTMYTKVNIHKGGISGNVKYSSEPTACFSNNDTNISMDITRTIEVGRNGSDAFSSEQMRSAAFLEELNMYPTLEMDGPIWTQDNKGGYPYIAELYKTTSVVVPKANESISNRTIYNLSGQRLDKARKGINIIDGKKVMVK